MPNFTFVDFPLSGSDPGSGNAHLWADAGGVLRWGGGLRVAGAIESDDHIFRVKTADQARVTFGPATDLVFDVVANGVYAVEAVCIYSGTTQGVNLYFGHQLPGYVFTSIEQWAITGDTTRVQDCRYDGFFVPVPVAGAKQPCGLRGIFKVGVTPGQFAVAINLATIYAGSYLIARRLA